MVLLIRPLRRDSHVLVKRRIAPQLAAAVAVVVGAPAQPPRKHRRPSVCGAARGAVRAGRVPARGQRPAVLCPGPLHYSADGHCRRRHSRAPARCRAQEQQRHRAAAGVRASAWPVRPTHRRKVGENGKIFIIWFGPGMASRGAGKKPTRWCSGTRAVLPGAGEPPSLVLCHPAARSVGFSVMVLCHPAAQQGSVPCGGALAPAPPAAQQGSVQRAGALAPGPPRGAPDRCPVRVQCYAAHPLIVGASPSGCRPY